MTSSPSVSRQSFASLPLEPSSYSSLPPLSRSELWWGNRRYAMPCAIFDFDAGEMLIAIGHPAFSTGAFEPRIFDNCEELWEYLAGVALDAREERQAADAAAEADRLRRRAEAATAPPEAIDGLDLGIDL